LICVIPNGHCRAYLAREQQLIRTLLIADDRESVELLGSLVRSTGELTLERVVPVVPGSHQLTMALQTLAPDVILLDVSDAGKAFKAYEQIRAMSTDIPVVTCSVVFQIALTPFALQPPLSSPRLLQTIRAAMNAGRVRHENVIAMLPAKAGGGATTIAINAAARLARMSGKRVLVCESDLRSGVIAELLGLKPNASMQQALEFADNAETLIWPRHICHKSGVDFLLTRREQTIYQPRWHDYHHLLSFASQRYDTVIVDMPDRINDATAEVVQCAKRVYVTTTPEILSLSLAKERIAELHAIGVDSSSLRVIVNRQHSSDMQSRQIEEILNCPVELVIPNHYSGVRAATLARTFVDDQTTLGRAYEKCAGLIASGYRPVLAAENKSSLFGFLRPARRYAETMAMQRG
jgi:Flp pilus assembly CpaE family ATPase